MPLPGSAQADNPFARVDWIGSVLLPLFLLFRGLPVLGWVKPLELDLEKLRRPCRDGLLIAASGPAANLLLALAGIGVIRGLNAAGSMTSPFLLQVLPFFCLANACLGVFNLLPIPPLAGASRGRAFSRRRRPVGLRRHQALWIYPAPGRGFFQFF